MGREIRRVPPNWKHPERECRHYPKCDQKYPHYQPQYDEEFNKAAKEWLDNCIAWANGTHPSFKENKDDCPFYWMYEGEPPSEEYYRKYKDEEATWFQIYETVSEGTPVTPPFETKEELVQYLIKNGDYWDQQRGHGGWEEDNARRFCDCGYAPSGIFDGTSFKTPRDM